MRRGPSLGPVRAVLEAGLSEGIAPALAAAVLHRGRYVHRSASGRLGSGLLPENALFDVASLTKVMASGTLAALLAAEGALDLDAPAARWLPGFGGDKAGITVRHLLAHSSGLPAWRPLVQAGRPAPSPEQLEAAVAAEPLEAPPGARAVYSDLGFVALGILLERAGGGPLDALFDERVASPLRLGNALFLPDRGRRAPREVVPTVVRETGEVLAGRANDENARAMGGVAGHAGLFSSAADAASVGQAWLDSLSGRSRLLPAAVPRAFAARDATPGSTRALAWDLPSGEAPAIGSRLGRGPGGAIGHLGFTGCSLWIDLDEEVVCALLTNHCPRVGEGEAIRAFRRRFHDAVAEALGIGGA